MNRFFFKETLRQELIFSLHANSISESELLARQLLVRSPTDELPFEAALALAIERGNGTESENYAFRVLERQPRSLAARLHLMQLASVRQQLEEVIHHFERLVELRSLNEDLLCEALIGVFRENGDWSDLIEYLKTRPAMGEHLVRRMLREGDLLPEFKEVLVMYPSLQSTYLHRVIEESGIGSAFEAWKALTFVSEAEQEVWPFNGSFEPRPAPPPFNWSIRYGRAELMKGGGLFVSYPGTGSPLIVRQILSAPSGRYRLETKAIGVMSERRGALEWRMSCSGTANRLGSQTLAINAESRVKVLKTDFSIPATACEFQTLELYGVSGAFPITSQIEIQSVSLVETNTEMPSR